MRKDSIGFFWTEVNDKTLKKLDLLQTHGWVEITPGYWAASADDVPLKMDFAYKELKGRGDKREPPEPVWLEPDYLPHYEEGLQFNVNLFTDAELIAAGNEFLETGSKHPLIFDIECYPNYFLIAFKSLRNGKITYLEMEGCDRLNIFKLEWILHHFTVVGFFSKGYDIPMALIAINGADTDELYSASQGLIEYGQRPRDILKAHGIKDDKAIDHIDIIEVAPLSGSLKIYAGRLHSKRMQDLPFPPQSELSPEQIVCMRWYCVNDLNNTEDLFNKLDKEIELRLTMSVENGIDLRSKSDAQIAEAILSKRISEIKGRYIKRPSIEPGTSYKYQAPGYLVYHSELMRYVLNEVRAADFIVNDFGKVGMPDALKELKIRIGSTDYQMGIGGLHSCESNIMHYADSNYILLDRDVASYYPAIILNNSLYPKHLGPDFLRVYREIVERRLAAKKAGDKVVADSLKITINGSFGKFGSMYSILYAPDLLIQVTVTGQLSLLLLIERLELAGIKVVSANTDGLVIKCHKSMEARMDEIVQRWEFDTNFETEATPYAALLSRDVNNYIAVKADMDGVKSKGAFAKPGLSKNPTSAICIDAVEALLLTGATIEQTVHQCTDPRRFVTVRTVKGGAVKDGEYLGKAIRWYYAKGADGEIVYAMSGNKVPRSDGARPLMDLPDNLPEDINYDWYVGEAQKMLRSSGYPI